MACARGPDGPGKLTIDEGLAAVRLNRKLTMTSRFGSAISLVHLALLGATQIGCGGSAATTSRTIEPDLPWQALRLPVSQLKVPSLLVGNDEAPSSGCFADATITSGTSVNQGSWTFEKNNQLNQSLQASFEHFLVAAKMSEDMAKAQTQKWTIQVTGLTYDSVDPATIQANFDNDNDTCTDADLDWFRNQRFVATRALKAATVSVKSDSALSDAEKAQLDVAIDAINAKLGTGFGHASSTSNSMQFTASNVYIGVDGTTLGAFDCHIDKPIEMPADAQTPICDGKYLVALSKSHMDGRYSVKVTPQRAKTSEFDAPQGSQAMFKIGKLQVIFVMAQATGDKFTLQTFDVLKVGAKG